MNALCLDIGNTSIKCCKIINDKINKIDNVLKSDNLISFLKVYNLNDTNHLLISSVVPNLSKQIKELFNTKNIEIFEVSYKNSGINLEVDNPSEVGADRICNVSAANKIYGSPSIIIDFGTATTYDITNDEGNFIGGAIAPGIDVSADNLISKASLLKDTVYQFPKSIIGKNTISNIQSGVMFSGLHSVKGMIQQIKDEMGFQNPKIILIV